jgi:XFP N-terminal domain
MRDGIALARHVNLLSALTSKTRHATKSGEVRHFATLLNSGDPATLLPGTSHAPVKSVDVLGTQRMVPLEKVRTNPEHLKILEGWLRSYRPQELFDELGALRSELADIAPKGLLRMGMNRHANGANSSSLWLCLIFVNMQLNSSAAKTTELCYDNTDLFGSEILWLRRNVSSISLERHRELFRLSKG